MDASREENSGEANRMTATSRHYFGGDSSQFNHHFTVDINCAYLPSKIMEEDYGMFVWPCSTVLSEYVWQQRSRFQGVSVLELGAGTSLPGIVAAKLGSDVTLTDKSQNSEVLSNMRSICDLNKVNCQIIGLNWGEWDSEIFNLHPKIILGADVLYFTSGFDDLFATVTFLLKNSPEAVFITAYHNRSGHHLIEMLMVKWRLKCMKIVDAFSFMPPQKASTLHGSNIQLIEITLDK